MILEAEEEGVRIAPNEKRLVKFRAVVEVRAAERKSGERCLWHGMAVLEVAGA